MSTLQSRPHYPHECELALGCPKLAVGDGSDTTTNILDRATRFYEFVTAREQNTPEALR